ncbi:unnamed protein product [Rotaria sordida]|uniref:Uncharacterized protein n=1 Tax=Rotaria sordida TaxID=392033 RepID=A0A815Q7R0_9BILA|nr:unnamed protein product [Rotaria sordida]CAF4091053.1 unnamed protein product [Rotaria sordida]
MTHISASNYLLLCPISHVLFHDPVLAQDGHTYERNAIEEWIRRHGTSPMTAQPLYIKDLYPNHLVKKIVDSFEALTRDKKYVFTLDIDLRKKAGRLFQANGKTIYYAEWLPNNENRPKIVLLKIDGFQAKKEASFYVELTRHPNIVRTYGFVYDKNNNEQNKSVLLVQEYASDGNLYELLLEHNVVPKEKVLIQMFLQIIEAMIYLASNHIVHGDLACRNVLVFRFDSNHPEKNVVKITDFGLSRYSQLYSTVPTNAQTKVDIVPVRYAAPEVLIDSSKPDHYTEKSDVYSMGVLMWEAYSRSTLPWADLETDYDVIQRVTNSDFLPQPVNCSQSYWSIILKTWAKSPNDRPSFTELKHLLAEQYYRSDNSLNNNIPAWRRTIPGICLEGSCMNKSCIAFNQGNVVICIGMKKFDIVCDSNESTTKCPMCSTYVDPKRCAFNNCFWRWSGIKQCANNPPSRCFDNWKRVGNEYCMFEETTDESLHWRQLMFEAKPL